MKIHYLSDIYFGEQNAGTTHTLEICNRLSKKNEIHLICQKPENEIEILKKLYIPVFGTNRILRMIIFNVLFWILYPAYFYRGEKPDLFYQRFDGTLFLSPAVLFSKLYNIPLVMEVNGIMVDEASLKNSPKLYTYMLKFCEKIYYSRAYKIIAVTEGLKEEITKLYNIPEEKVTVIGNGVNTEVFKPLLDSFDLKKKYGLTGKKIVTFVGVLEPWQGLEYLVESAKKVLENKPDVVFLIIGNGPLKKILIKKARDMKIEENFVFTGSVPYEEVPIYINMSDMCVAPFILKRNDKIGISPLKIYEYMACGKAIVCSKIKNLHFLDEIKAGILVEPENPHQISEAILKLLDNEKLRNEMGKRGREETVNNYSWDSIAKRVEDLCLSIV